jgi:hypothetical protein
MNAGRGGLSSIIHGAWVPPVRPVPSISMPDDESTVDDVQEQRTGGDDRPLPDGGSAGYLLVNHLS